MPGFLLAWLFFGLGISNANANAARTTKPSASGYCVQRLGYLDQRMFGYALACYTRMRNDPAPKWESYLTAPLTAPPREYMNRGLTYLRKAALYGLFEQPYGGFPTEQRNR